jgi:hypothetical protein
MCMIKLPYSFGAAINCNVKTNSYHLAPEAGWDKLDLLAARYYWFENCGQRGIVCHPSIAWSACMFGRFCGCVASMTTEFNKHDH